MIFHLRNHVSTEDTWSGCHDANCDFRLPTDDIPFRFESYWLTLRFVTIRHSGAIVRQRYVVHRPFGLCFLSMNLINIPNGTGISHDSAH